MSSIIAQRHPALESVQHQKNPALFMDLLIEFKNLSDIPNPSRSNVESLRIPEILFKHTGMNIAFICEPDKDINAYVVPPDINKNHPLIIDWLKHFHENGESLKLLRKLKATKLTGYVDRVKGKVSGVFSDLEAKIGLNLGCFYKQHNGVKLTSEEVTAIFLHECGHLFGWYELVANQMTTNQALRAVKETFLKSNDKKLRIDILKELGDVLGADVKDVNMVAETVKDESGLAAVVLKTNVDAMRSELGSNIYDQRGFEYLADQYAVRMGAGVHIATGLDKLYKSGWHPSYRSTFIHLITSVLDVVSFVFLSFVTWGAWPLICLLIGDPIENGETMFYDRPGERFARVRRELIDSLKQSKLPKDVVKRIVEDIKVIEGIESNVKDRWSIGAAIYGYIFPSAKRARKQISDQQLLENLANNSLYVSAAELSVIS